jgi:hypothetical protein
MSSSIGNIPSANEDYPSSAALGAEFESYDIFTQVAAKLGVRGRRALAPQNPLHEPVCTTIYRPTWLTVPRGLFEPRESVVSVVLAERVIIPHDMTLEAEVLGPDSCFAADEERLVVHWMNIMRATMKPDEDNPSTPVVLRQHRRPGVMVVQNGADTHTPMAASPSFEFEHAVDPVEFTLQQMDYGEWLGRLATQQLA